MPSHVAVPTHLGAFDSYFATTNSSANLNSDVNLEYGQSFLVSTTGSLSHCIFYLLKSGNPGSTPVGVAYAKVYEHSGTFGSSSLPTGTALAVSDPKDISGVTTSSSPNTFTFSGVNRIILSESTHYVLVCAFSGSSSPKTLFVSSRIIFNTHQGNASKMSVASVWSVVNVDLLFYVYGQSPHTSTPTHIASPTHF